MADRTPITHLRKQILNRKEKVFLPHTRKPVPAPLSVDEYPKTPKMKYLELKYQCDLVRLLHAQSLADTEQFFRHEVDKATLSRWRKRIQKYLGLVEVMP